MKHFYLVLDTETATLPFIDEYTKDNPKMRKNLAIAKPLVYDIGWVVIDRQGNIFKKVNYLVQETFFVPNVFNTAYYRDKRPQYMKMLAKGEITAKGWNDIIPELMEDAAFCRAVGAYNAAFDFKKAIPFTERYIYALYYGDYNAFEDGQRASIAKSCAEDKVTGKNADYLNPVWKIRGEEFPIIDLWDIACKKLINIDRYRKYCLENDLWTESVQYFKTSAETSFQYLMHNYDFEESHTALDDALIESQILAKALRKGKIDPCMGSFPFRELGTTVDFATTKGKKYIPALLEALEEYVTKLDETSNYTKKILKMIEKLGLE